MCIHALSSELINSYDKAYINSYGYKAQIYCMIQYYDGIGEGIKILGDEYIDIYFNLASYSSGSSPSMEDASFSFQAFPCLQSFWWRYKLLLCLHRLLILCEQITLEFQSMNFYILFQL